MARRATAALLLLAAAALVASARAQDGGSTTGSVPTTGDAASPAADVDFASIKSPERKVDALAWDTAYTPTDEGLEPGASAATPDGKAYGTSGVSYADSRFGTGYWDAAKPSGKLLFDIPGQGTYMCSATLIGKSLLLTAAHCVFNYGTNATSGFFINWRFYPQQTGSSTPYGYWLGSAALVATSYYAGTDTCMTGAEGVVCNNDLALIWLQATGSTIAKQAGDAVGYFGYSWNGYSFATPAASGSPTPTSVFGTKPYVQITQLGYPAAFDSSTTMQIANSPGFKYASNSSSTGKELRQLMRGTSLTGGSSGGPWVVNFGVNATLSGTAAGSDAARNRIAGVTSWGYTSDANKIQGVSWFGQNAEFPNSAYGTRGAGNIGKLVYDACDNPAGWGLQAKGYCL